MKYLKKCVSDSNIHIFIGCLAVFIFIMYIYGLTILYKIFKTFFMKKQNSLLIDVTCSLMSVPLPPILTHETM